MTIDEAIKHAEEVAEEQEELYRLCPVYTYRCDGTKDCIALKNGTNKGCQKCAKEHRQLAKWLKELKQLREQTRWVPVSEGPPDIDEEVLVDDGLDIFVAWWVDDGFEARWHSNDESYSPDRPILAWQPSPKHYKVESEE